MSGFFSNLTNKFKPASRNVGIFISQASIVEIVEFDCETLNVLKYGSAEINMI